MSTRAGQSAQSRREWARRQWVALRLADDHGGVVTWTMLREAGLTQGQIRTQVERGVWIRAGSHTLCIKGTEPSGQGAWWWALWESGRSAVLDGISALFASGLRNWEEPTIHVSVPHDVHPRALPGVRHHRLRDMGELTGSALRRTRPEVAVVRAANWAATDRQAATLVAMTVQQRLVTPAAVMREWSLVTRSPRRAFLSEVVADVCNGAQSLGELDFARLCRQRGLPSPSRQVIRTGPDGRIYLDVFWEPWCVHVEIQGAQHFQADALVRDALRTNHLGIQLQGLISLQIPVLGLRTRPEQFMDQVEAALIAQGWHRPAA